MIAGHLCILGAGNMGRALVGGLLRAGQRPEHLSVGESAAPAREALAREFGLSASSENLSAVRGASVVVLAVKPYEIPLVLAPLSHALVGARPLIVSVAAGVRIAALEAWCGPDVPVVRAMPNRPALVGAGVSGLYAPPSVTGAQRDTAEQVLRSVGEVLWVSNEDALDAVTALSGSGPAYFFLLAELMAEAGVQLGLPDSAARRLAAATLYGAGQLTQVGETDLGRLRTEITSRGGTTEAALRILDGAHLRDLVTRALVAAAQRSRDLGAKGTP